MRTLELNKRSLFYANPTGTQRVVEDGYLTPDFETTYETPVQLKVNYSACTGQEAIEIFGDATNYSRVIVLTVCPMVEGAKVWIGRPITEESNYKVVKVADSLNSFAVALQEVK